MVVDDARVLESQQEIDVKYGTEESIEKLIIMRNIRRRNNTHKMIFSW